MPRVFIPRSSTSSFHKPKDTELLGMESKKKAQWDGADRRYLQAHWNVSTDSFLFVAFADQGGHVFRCLGKVTSINYKSKCTNGGQKLKAFLVTSFKPPQNFTSFILGEANHSSFTQQGQYAPHTDKKWDRAKKKKPEGAWLKDMVELYVAPKGTVGDGGSGSDEDELSAALFEMAKDTTYVVSSLSSSSSSSSSPGALDSTGNPLPTLPPRDPNTPQKRKSASAGSGADAEQKVQRSSSDGTASKHRSKTGLCSLCFIIS
jgi:hypothetical protein